MASHLMWHHAVIFIQTSQRMNDTHNQFQSESLTIITINPDLGVPGDETHSIIFDEFS